MKVGPDPRHVEPIPESGIIWEVWWELKIWWRLVYESDIRMARDRRSKIGYVRGIAAKGRVYGSVQSATVVIACIGEHHPRVEPKEFGWYCGRFVGVGVH